MLKPRISIITITYNSEEHLEDTIKSIISQNYDNLEYIIIDGASTDKTLDIANNYKDYISVLVSEKDRGISDAFNKGIAIASGEIIGIINSDDLLEPGALHRIANAYNPSIDVYSGNLAIWNDITGECRIQVPDVNFDKLRLQYNVAHPARFIRKDAYDRWGTYSIDLKYKMDIDLLVRFAHAGARIVHVDATFARFRTGGTTSQPIWKKKNDFREFVTRNGWSVTQYRCIWAMAVIKYYIKYIINIFSPAYD